MAASAVQPLQRYPAVDSAERLSPSGLIAFRTNREILLMPRAFITGITGQDGQHLAAFLHAQGYDVYGMVKGQSNPRVAPAARRDAVHRDHSGRSRRSPVARRGARVVTARRGVQPRCDLVRRAQLQPGRAHRQHHRTRCACACWKRFAWSVAPRTIRSGSTRPPRRRCSARCAKHHRPRRPRSTHAARTVAPRSSGTTSPSTTGRATGCTPARASSSTMKVPNAASSSSPER